ncbi:MAG: hypothetical protein MMC23_007299 [Stictis urceolatum]|nr:hypothetical protein [Stictis urceolata]
MKVVVSLLGLLATASAHATWQELTVNGVDQAGKCVRLPPSNSPITSVTSNDIRCNVGGMTGISGVCDVTAGQTIAPEMHQQPGDRSCAEEAIGGAHCKQHPLYSQPSLHSPNYSPATKPPTDGPVIMYMSKVTDATTADGSSPWFKVNQNGYNTANSTWGNQILNADCGKWTFTVPASIAPGQYLLRAETIALHTASSVGGAQFYVSCYQLNVKSSGTATPSGVSFPGAYKATDPGIEINIYTSITSYPVPGPTVYAG